jgi:hypothetical protein
MTTWETRMFELALSCRVRTSTAYFLGCHCGRCFGRSCLSGVDAGAAFPSLNYSLLWRQLFLLLGPNLVLAARGRRMGATI